MSAPDQPLGMAGPALSVSGAARGLGIAPATLRSWERRYGLGPSRHTKGGHRRYGPDDLAQLQVMHRLVRDGVPPAEAARVAVGWRSTLPSTDPDAPYASLLAAAGLLEPVAQGPSGDGGPTPGAVGGATPVPTTRAHAGGGRVLALPHSDAAVRGLARAALAMDARWCLRATAESLAQRGAVRTWEELVRPVLAAIGERWARSGQGVEVEHCLSAVVGVALAAHADRLGEARNDRPVLLASCPDELHDLPLVALRAALADASIRAQHLGARTPADALGRAVDRLGPPVLVLWAEQPGVLPEMPAIRPAPAVLLAGPGWSDAPADWTRVNDLLAAVGAVRSALGH